MEDNNTNEKEIKSTPKDINIESFIEKIINNFSKNKNFFITGKTVSYMNLEEYKGNIIFQIKIYKNSEINPFTSDILIDIEFIPNKVPYARIKSDFVLPSLYDNRNFFYCLTNDHEYIYDPNNLKGLENLLNDIFNTGIENFLLFINENLTINNFIYYGEYELNTIYNINDFLENSKLIKLYRVNQILEKGKEIEEKYIIVTQLYILIFRPQEKDKTFAELKFKKKLKNVSFNYKKHIFNKKVNSNTLTLLIQDIKTPNGKTYEIEFSFIDRSRPPVEKKPEEESEESEDDEVNVNININKDNNNKNDTSNKNKNNNINKNNIKNMNNNNNVINNEETDIWDKYYQFEEEIEKKQREINFSKYKLVIEAYRPLFSHRSNTDKKLKGIEFKNQIMEYEKMFQHCEKIYNYYAKMKDNKKYKKRMEYYMVNINFFCAELMGFFDLEKASFKFYFDKMKYYLELNENNQ